MLKALLKLFTGNDENESSSARNTKLPSGESGDIHELEGFVDYVVCLLVDHPDEVSVKTEEDDNGCSIQISCRKEDIGKIVGKRGKTIMAIRSLVSSGAGRLHKRVSVEVLD